MDAKEFQSSDSPPRGSFSLPNFQCPEDARVILEREGMLDLLKALRKMHDLARKTDVALVACTSFQFHKKEHVDELFRRNVQAGSMYFWREVNLILVFISRSVPRALQKLTVAFLWAIGSKNELTMALSLRALMEHASGLHSLKKTLTKHQERLGATVWPALKQQIAIKPQDEDKSLRQELVRFALGRRVQPQILDFPSLSDSKGEWERFLKSIQVKKDEDFYPRQLLNDVDCVSAQEGWHHWRVVYEILCEFCHSNSASRTADFSATMDEEGLHMACNRPEEVPDRGVLRILSLSRLSVPIASILVQEALSCVSACRMQIPPLKETPSDTTPRIGAILIRDQYGRVFWVDRESLDRNAPVQELSSEQKERIRLLWRVFRDVDDKPLGSWFDDFARDHFPDQELRLWEHLAKVYHREVAERSDCRVAVRKLVYRALIATTLTNSMDDLISAYPELKTLAQLDRIFRRVNARQNHPIGI